MYIYINIYICVYNIIYIYIYYYCMEFNSTIKLSSTTQFNSIQFDASIHSPSPGACEGVAFGAAQRATDLVLSRRLELSRRIDQIEALN